MSQLFRITTLLLLMAWITPRQFAASQETETRVDRSTLYRAALAAAEKSMRLSEVRDARRWLDLAPMELRGWEWNYLEALSDESLIQKEIEQTVTSIAVAPNGELVALADTEGVVKLFRLPQCDEVGAIGDHHQAVYAVAFSSDSTRLVTVSRDVTSRVWEIATGNEISRIQLDNPGVAAATFSPDGKQVATCTWMRTRENGENQVYGAVWIWDAATGEVQTKQRVGVKPLDSIHWSSDGSRIAVGSWDGLVHILDRQANEIRRLTVPDDGVYTAVIAVAISADGRLVACGSKDRTARVWDIESAELLATMQGHEGFVNEVAFQNGDQQLVTAGIDGTLRVWDAATGKQRELLRGHTASVAAFGRAPNGQVLVSAGRDNMLRVWDLQAGYGGGLQTRVETEGVYTTTFSPDGGLLYLACYDGQVRKLDARSGRIIGSFVAHAESTCNTLSLSGDGSRLLTCSWDKTGKLWDVREDILLRTFDAGAGVYDCALSSDGKFAALAVGNRIQVWETETGHQLGVCDGLKDTIRETVFSPDGKLIAGASGSEGARIWSVEACEAIATLQISPNTGALANPGAQTIEFSPDGKQIATGAAGIVSLWDGGTFEHQFSVNVGDRSINRVVFSPDKQRLAVGSDAVTLIDPSDPEPLLRFQPNKDDIYFLSFSPDGSRLATGTTGGSVVITESEALKHRRAKPASR